MEIYIVPIEEGHIEGFHRALDFVARERRYLSFLEAPPLESTRAFVLDNIKRGRPEFVAVVGGRSGRLGVTLQRSGRSMPGPVCWAWACCRHSAARG